MTNDEDVERLRRRIAAKNRALNASRAELRKLFGLAKDQRRDLKLAACVHRTLLPEAVRHERIHLDVRYVPIEQVGGDYCQVRFPDPDTCYITMCDVTGHGVGAALLATRVSSEVRNWILGGLAPCDIVRSLNILILDHFSETNLYLSFIAVRIDLPRHQITWSGAGHPSPLLIRRDGTTVERLRSQNLLIGVSQECLADQPEGTATVEPCDRLVLYTDGLTEVEDAEGDQLGTDGLADIATVAMNVDLFDMADHILDRVSGHPHGPPDDKTLIVAELQ